MSERASAIIVSKRHLLLMHRIRTSQDFYVFPGGHIEEGESAEEACIREVQEETGLQTAWLRAAFDYAPPVSAPAALIRPPRLAHYFFVRTHPGNLILTGPEVQKQSEENRYLLEWVPLAQIGRYNLRPEAVRDALAALLGQYGPMREASDLALYREQLQEILKT